MATVAAPDSRSSSDPIPVVFWLGKPSSWRRRAEQAWALSEMTLTDLGWSRPAWGSEGWRQEIVSLGRQARSSLAFNNRLIRERSCTELNADSSSKASFCSFLCLSWTSVYWVSIICKALIWVSAWTDAAFVSLSEMDIGGRIILGMGGRGSAL